MRPFLVDKNLVDVNVVLALLVEGHQFHSAVVRWFDTLEPADFGLCRIAQLGAVRLLANPSIMRDGVLTAGDAWNLVVAFAEDERVEFIAEPERVDHFLSLYLSGSGASHNHIADSYLAALSRCTERQLITFDRGFRNFEGLDVRVLAE